MLLAAIVESSEDAIISKDLNGRVLSWNHAAERMFGYAADEMIGKPILTIIPKDREKEEEWILGCVRTGERIKHFDTVRQRKDGGLIDISLTVSPVKDPQGRIVGASKIARDIRDRKEAEAAREFLLREIKHRVKNMLSVVQAIASQTFRNAPRSELTAFIDRVQVLASSHDLLTQHNWQSAGITQIVQMVLLPFLEPLDQRVKTDGTPVQLSPNKTLLLSMALHELATNAVKYGALSNDGGTVELTWSEVALGEQRLLSMSWRERNGPLVAAPQSAGFGTQMITRAFHSEKGSASFEYPSDGLVCTMTLPL